MKTTKQTKTPATVSSPKLSKAQKQAAVGLALVSAMSRKMTTGELIAAEKAHKTVPAGKGMEAAVKLAAKEDAKKPVVVLAKGEKGRMHHRSEKKETTEKAAKTETTATTEKAAKTERVVISGESVITVAKGAETPFRAGSKGAVAFETMKTGQTVGEWREALIKKDGDPGYLHAILRRGLVTVK